MIITVAGKAHFQGTSKKTGNPYDFITIHYLSKAARVDGMAAMTANIDPAMMRYEDIQVTHQYNIDFDNRGYVVDFFPVDGKSGKF